MTVATQWVYHFEDALPADVTDAKQLLGGKGASLGDMTRAGLAVPPGFTITTACCERYFELGRQWPEGLEEQVREQLARLETQAGRTFGQGDKPLLVSVRSGAAHSMPGMMDTLLNCGLNPALAQSPPQGVGDTPHFWQLYAQFILMFARTVHGLEHDTFADLLASDSSKQRYDRDTVQACLRRYQQQTGKTFPTDPWDALVACIDAVFDSWHNDRAIAYRQRNDIRDLKGTAVNIQMMFPSEKSGIVFTQDPNHQRPELMVIESAYGLGEAVVSGDITPDRFLVQREGLACVEKHIGQKAGMVVALGEHREVDPDAPSLDDAQLRELCELSLRVEKHFGHPVDIEWGYADGRFSLLQSRAIRGLEIAQDVEVGRQAEIQRLKDLAAGKRHVWVAHNLGETLRFPTPLTWCIVKRFMRGDGGFGRMYQELGYRPSQRVREDGFLDLICGRIYADPHRMAELFWDGMPLTYDLDELIRDKHAIDAMPSQFDGEKANNHFLRQLPANLMGMRRVSKNMRQARAEARDDFENIVLPSFLDFVKVNRARNLDALNDEQLLAELERCCKVVLDQFAPASLLPGFIGGMAYTQLKDRLVQLLGLHQGETLASTLTRALEGDTTFEQDNMLYQIAQGQGTLDAFIEQYGHRCIGEMELSTPRWRENATYLEQTLARMRRSDSRNPAQMHHENLEARHEVESHLPATLRDAGGSIFEHEIHEELRVARELLPYREAGKHYLMMGYELIRNVIEALARRWDLGQGIYFLHDDELRTFATRREALMGTIEDRRTRWQSLQRLDVPDVIDSRSLDDLGLARALTDADELTGSAVAAGIATGTVRIVHQPQDAGDLGQDYVLVCPSTDPGWTPLFLGARGLVVERGGVLSHGAIVARDFGIPAVVCEDATRLLKDGQRVRIDGNQGRVSVLDGEVKRG